MTCTSSEALKESRSESRGREDRGDSAWDPPEDRTGILTTVCVGVLANTVSPQVWGTPPQYHRNPLFIFGPYVFSEEVLKDKHVMFPL